MYVLFIIACIITACQASFYIAVCSKSKGFFPVLVSGVCMIDGSTIVMTNYDTYSLFVSSDGHDQSGYNVEVYRYGVGTSVTYAKSIAIIFPDGSTTSHDFDQSNYCDASGRKYYSWSNAADEVQAWAYDYCHSWCSTEPN